MASTDEDWKVKTCIITVSLSLNVSKENEIVYISYHYALLKPFFASATTLISSKKGNRLAVRTLQVPTKTYPKKVI